MFRMFRNRRILTVTLGFLCIAVLAVTTLVVAQGSFFQVPGGGIIFDITDPVMRFVGKLAFQSQPGGTKFAMINSKGHYHLSENTTLPTTGDLSADAEVGIFVCGDRLGFAFNNAGTRKFVSIALDGSATAWTQTATTPGGCS